MLSSTSTRQHAPGNHGLGHSASLCKVAPALYNGKQYDSASAALEAYIRDFEGRPSTKDLRRQCDAEMIDLLMNGQFSKPGPDHISGSSLGTSGTGLQQYLTVRQLVDNSYSKLRRTNSELKDSELHRSLAESDRLLTRLTTEGLSPFPSATSLLTLPESTNTDILLSHSTIASTRPPGDHSALQSRETYGRDVDESYLADPFYEATAVTPGEISASGVNFSDIPPGQGESFALNPRGTSGRARSSFYSAEDPNDSVNLLFSAKPHREKSSRGTGRLPSWVDDLEKSTPGDQDTLIHGRSQPSTPADVRNVTSPTRTPKKQLRFDLNYTQESTAASSEHINASSFHYSRGDGTSESPPYRGGYLGGIRQPRANKASSPEHMQSSLTTEDVALENLQVLQRRREFAELGSPSRKHGRSFSASARLCSTPVREWTRSRLDTASRVEIGNISGLSSVRDSIASSVREGQAAGSPSPSSRVRGGATGNAMSLRERSPTRSQTPREQKESDRRNCDGAPQALPADHGDYRLCGGQGLSATHKDYLQNLLRDIEDSSSSVVTGVPELEELIAETARALNGRSVSPSLGVASDLTDTDALSGVTPVGGVSGPSSVTSAESGPGGLDGRGRLVERLMQECQRMKEETAKALGERLAGQLDVAGTTEESYSPVGGLEALKNILFTVQNLAGSSDDQGGETQSLGGVAFAKEPLQSEEGRLGIQGHAVGGEAAHHDLSDATQRLLQLSSQPASDSLERAMIHLNRLQSMVQRGGRDSH